MSHLSLSCNRTLCGDDERGILREGEAPHGAEFKLLNCSLLQYHLWKGPPFTNFSTSYLIIILKFMNYLLKGACARLWFLTLNTTHNWIFDRLNIEDLVGFVPCHPPVTPKDIRQKCVMLTSPHNDIVSDQRYNHFHTLWWSYCTMYEGGSRLSLCLPIYPLSPSMSSDDFMGP